jgi:molecular chaperone GrpE
MTDPQHHDGDHAATEFEEFLEDISDGAATTAAPGETAPDDLSELDLSELDLSGDAPDHAPDGAGDAVSAESEVDVLTREVSQFKDTALRLQADFENYRKRVTAQQSVEIERAAGKVVESLLPVLDACEAAFTHGADGVEPIWSQLMGVLQKQGLEALDLAGKPFDPALADAVVHEDGEGAPGGGPVVSDVLRTGYSWKGKTLRAAMVKVRG